MGELLHGVRVVKALSWEPAFVARIAAARRRELRQLAVGWGADGKCAGPAARRAAKRGCVCDLCGVYVSRRRRRSLQRDPCLPGRPIGRSLRAPAPFPTALPFRAPPRHLPGCQVRKYLDALCVYFWASTQLLFSALTFGLMAFLGQPLRCGAAAGRPRCRQGRRQGPLRAQRSRPPAHAHQGVCLGPATRRRRPRAPAPRSRRITCRRGRTLPARPSAACPQAQRRLHESGALQHAHCPPQVSVPAPSCWPIPGRACPLPGARHPCGSLPGARHSRGPPAAAGQPACRCQARQLKPYPRRPWCRPTNPPPCRVPRPGPQRHSLGHQRDG
jgi:hypothetical protein